jgi:secondary thiamine-phosphate synthase enzyme
MMIRTITIQSSHKTEVINVTEQLAALIGDVQHGLAHFNVPHTTAALIVCEDDAELRDDLVRAVENLLADVRPFKHARQSNPNAEAHIISALSGPTLVLAIENGRLDLGTYQNALLLEMDGPRRREIRCMVLAAP